jgi:hypothetical protein
MDTLVEAAVLTATSACKAWCSRLSRCLGMQKLRCWSCLSCCSTLHVEAVAPALLVVASSTVSCLLGLAMSGINACLYHLQGILEPSIHQIEERMCQYLPAL